jgi:hypothetical protein
MAKTILAAAKNCSAMATAISAVAKNVAAVASGIWLWLKSFQPRLQAFQRWLQTFWGSSFFSVTAKISLRILKTTLPTNWWAVVLIALQ